MLRSSHSTPIDPRITDSSPPTSTSTAPLKPVTTTAVAAAASPLPPSSTHPQTASSTNSTATRPAYASSSRSTNTPAAPSLYHLNHRPGVPAHHAQAETSDFSLDKDDGHAATRRAAEAADAAVAVAAAAARAQHPATSRRPGHNGDHLPDTIYANYPRAPPLQPPPNGQHGMDAVAAAVAGEDPETWSGAEAEDDDGAFDGLGESRKRKRPVSVSCELCKHRKVKCDRAQPSCGWCLRNRQPCEYKERKKPGLRAGYGRELEARLDRLEEIIRLQAAAIAKLSGGTIQTMPLSPTPGNANVFHQHHLPQSASASASAASPASGAEATDGAVQTKSSPAYRYRNGFVLPVEISPPVL